MKKNKILKIFIAIILLVNIEISVIAATTGVVNVDTVRVRAKATTDSGIVVLVSIGDKVTITGEEGDWYKVQAKDENGKNKTGYIRKDLLTVDGETATINPDNNVDAKPVENNNDNKEEQKIDNNIDTESETPVEEVPTTNEQPVDEEEQTNESGAVTTKKDKTIDTIKASKNLSKGKTMQLEGNTKIKILPSANSSNIEELQAGTEVKVLEVINSWCRIETTEGECGWVRIDQ